MKGLGAWVISGVAQAWTLNKTQKPCMTYEERAIDFPIINMILRNLTPRMARWPPRRYLQTVAVPHRVPEFAFAFE